jgi:hypothetical protein
VLPIHIKRLWEEEIAVRCQCFTTNRADWKPARCIAAMQKVHGSAQGSSLCACFSGILSGFAVFRPISGGIFPKNRLSASILFGQVRGTYAPHECVMAAVQRIALPVISRQTYR